VITLLLPLEYLSETGGPDLINGFVPSCGKTIPRFLCPKMFSIFKRMGKLRLELSYGHESRRLYRQNSGAGGGRPRIAGHRIRVQDIVVLHEQQGQSLDEIVSAYPQWSVTDEAHQAHARVQERVIVDN
jgi:uncharacterized protein (DUF433 family)